MYVQFNYVGDVMPFNNDCGEKMLQYATKLLTGDTAELEFTYSQAVLDVQVDLGMAFVLLDDEMKQAWYSGGNKAELERDIKKLDKKNIYFMRTGTNAGPGHYQILHFINGKGWWIYSSEKNQYQLTDLTGKILEEATSRIMTKGPSLWGANHGQSMLLLVMVTYDSIISSANYLYSLRVKGEEQACSEAYEKDSKYILQAGIKIKCRAESPDLQEKIAYSTHLESTQRPELSKALVNIRKELNLLKTHAEKITQKNNKKSIAIMAVYNHVNDKFLELESSTRRGCNIEMQLSQFKSCAHELLHTHDPILNKHSQAWKPFLVNILIACTGIGLIAIALKAGVHITKSLTQKVGVDSNRLFFFSTTKSQSCIDQLEKEVNSVSITQLSSTLQGQQR